MKQKTILMISLCLFFTLRGFSQHLTDSYNSTSWEAYQLIGPPPTGGANDWREVNTPTDWGAPIKGDPSELQENMFNHRFGVLFLHNSPGVACGFGTSTNFVRSGPIGASPQICYFRNVITLDNTNSCAEYSLVYNSDDEAKIFVNGDLVDQTNQWQENGEVILSPYLKCGENIIAVEVTNSHDACLWFIGELKVKGLLSFDQEIEYELVNCDVSNPTIQFHAPDAKTYSWTGPNGFQSTDQNPIVDGIASNNGEYICTYTIACCTRTAKVQLVVPNSCCEPKIDILESDCSFYSFGVSSKFVENFCTKWELDGEEVESSANNFYETLTPGSHTICVRYLGTRSDLPSETCCGKACRIIDVPGNNAVYEELSLNKCSNHTTLAVNPCTILGGSSIYKITGTVGSNSFEYDSRVGSLNPVTHLWQTGCVNHQLDAGIYNINYYDANGCLIKHLVLTIIDSPC